MVVDGLRRAMQLARKLRVRAPLHQQFEYLDFSRGQPGGIAASRFQRAPGNLARAELAQSPAADVDKWSRAQTVSNGQCLAKCVLRTVAESERLLITHANPLP